MHVRCDGIRVLSCEPVEATVQHLREVLAGIRKKRAYIRVQLDVAKARRAQPVIHRPELNNIITTAAKAAEGR